MEKSSWKEIHTVVERYLCMGIEMRFSCYYGIGGLIFYNLLICSLRICNFNIFKMEE
jgi:hypothetical protein